MNSTQDTFTEFGSHFQDKLVYAIILDKQFAEQILEVLDITFFDNKYLRDTIQVISNHYTKYKKVPAISSIESSITEISDNISRDQAKLFIQTLKENINIGKIEDLDFVKDKSLDFCKKQNLKKALFKAADMLKYSKFDEIIDVIKKSISLGTSRDIGIVYSTDLDKRYDKSSNKIIATPWYQVDKIMNGGFSSRELHVIMAPVTRGKSHILAQIGVEAAKNGFNVVHYTLELSDKKTALRYDSCISKIPFDDLLEFKEIVKEKIGNLVKGNIIIKEFSTKTASSQTIRNHISKVRMRGLEPDIIIVDYADLMKPVTSVDAKRFDLESVYEDLRGIAGDFDVPVITATQSQRGAAEEDYISLESIGEAYLKAAVADTVISFSRKLEDMALGTGKFFFAKNRSGVSGLVLNVSIDTTISTITVLDEEASLPDVKKQQSSQQNKKMWVDRNNK
jgi:replicative DNA helicase